MTPGDFETFSARLIELGEVFDASLSEAKQVLYFEALRDLALEDVLAALVAAVRTSTFMPRPAELRTIACGDAEDQAETAWMLLHEAMRRIGAYASIATVDAALGETIVALFGGWPEACRAEFSPEMWASKRKEFGRVYRVYQQRGLRGHRYLIGLTEQQNAGRPDWLKYADVAILRAGETCRLLRGADADAYRGQLAASTGLQPLTDSRPTGLARFPESA